MLAITDLCKGYNGREVIHQVSFQVERADSWFDWRKWLWKDDTD